jgi:sulfide dehydrogenase [flavocytochrome c] flavoprotein chain
MSINHPSRRAVLAGAAAVAGSAGSARAATGPRVVVVGGGFGGATAARYLKRHDPKLRVTLIEAGRSHATCPFSNTVIAGLNPMTAIERDFGALRDKWGVAVVTDTVVAIDSARRMVTTRSGASYGYDRLILSPGVDFKWDGLEGYDEAASEPMPHAWKAGPQTLLLRRQLQAMPDGGLVVIAVPGGPIRCPPGPYERAGLIAWYLQQAKPRSKVMILDAKDGFTKDKLFLEGWAARYGAMVEWVPAGQNGRVVRVDAKAGTVETDFDTFHPAVTNVIPPHQAGAIAVAAGLAGAGGFCPVDPVTFESTMAKGIHVIGDACSAGEMPKSAFAANGQAKIAAAAVAALLAGDTPAAVPALNTCYSLVAPDYGISVVGVYEVRDGAYAAVKGAGGVSPLGANAHFRKSEADYAAGWYAGACRDAWG